MLPRNVTVPIEPLPPKVLCAKIPVKLLVRRGDELGEKSVPPMVIALLLPLIGPSITKVELYGLSDKSAVKLVVPIWSDPVPVTVRLLPSVAPPRTKLLAP